MTDALDKIEAANCYVRSAVYDHARGQWSIAVCRKGTRNHPHYVVAPRLSTALLGALADIDNEPKFDRGKVIHAVEASKLLYKPSVEMDDL